MAGFPSIRTIFFAASAISMTCMATGALAAPQLAGAGVELITTGGSTLFGLGAQGVEGAITLGSELSQAGAEIANEVTAGAEAGFNAGGDVLDAPMADGIN